MLQGRNTGSKGLVFKNCLISSKAREPPNPIVGWIPFLSGLAAGWAHLCHLLNTVLGT